MIDPADRPALPGTAVYAHDGVHRGTAAGVSPDPGGGWFDDPTPNPSLTTPSTTPDAPVTDAASGTVEVTRSEEQLRLTTQSVPVGRMRVCKRIVTEEQTVTVQVRREEFVLESVAVSPANPDDEPHDYALGTQQGLVMVLHAERPVVSVEVVPVERVTVHIDVATADQVVVGARCVARRSWSTTTGRRHTTLTPAGGRASGQRPAEALSWQAC